ncbi:hypothetical protein JCM3765_007227 [Sporobolomyces pararoseus]
MEQLLNRTQTVLLGFDASHPGEASLKEISNLVSSFQASATSNESGEGLPTSISNLPREILLRIAELIKVPQDLGVDTNEREEEEDGDSGELFAYETGCALRKQLLIIISTTKGLSRSRQERSASFKTSATALLRLSVPLVQLTPPSASDTPERTILASEASLLIAFSKFLQPDFSTLFSTTESKELASHFVSLLLASSASSKRLPLLTHLLRNSLPIHFKPNPKLNPSTGRVLNRPLGGPRSTDDWNEESDRDGGWKREVGLSGTVLTIIQNLKAEELEDLWPWLLPPILSYLDDFNPHNKILGLHLLDSLLNSLSNHGSQGSSSLLVRTGVGKVFKQSLAVIFSNLSDPLSLRLQSLSQPISLKLLNLLQRPLPPASLSLTASEADRKKRKEASQARFEALCQHFQETVLKVWQYKSDHYQFELLQLSDTCGVLPWVGESYGNEGEGGGGAEVIRYLGILIPHLTGIVKGDEKVGVWNEQLIKLRLRVVVVLRGMMRNRLVQNRVRKNWEDPIVASLARCWVGLKEDGEVAKMRKGKTGEKELVENFETELKELVKTLREDSASREEESGGRNYWKELRELDPMFEELVV